MDVRELNKDQLEELKVSYYDEKMGELGRGISYGEIVNINELVSDDEIFNAYEDVSFTEDDFFCSESDCEIMEE